MKRTVFTLAVLLMTCTAGFAEKTGVLPGGPVDFPAVKPILLAKCGVCHASEAKRPFSSKIPVWNYAVGTNIGLAREKYDMDVLLKQGDAADAGQRMILEQVVAHDKMPPVQYRLIHPRKRLNEQEREMILNWIHAKQKQS